MLNEILAHGKAAHHVAKICSHLSRLATYLRKKEVTLLVKDLQTGHADF